MPRLSKSRFMAGWQCPLRLWYSVHRPELAPPPDEALQAIFDAGHLVGELARQRYPGGILIADDHHQVQAAAQHTAALMHDPKVPALYEAAILHADVLTRVDILRRNDYGWDLIEVKSSGTAKEHFEVDVAVQYWILASAGIPVRHAGLLLLNREYVYPGGPYDLEALFRFEDLTESCRAAVDSIGAEVERLHRVAAQAEPPDIDIGDHCHSPYECPFLGHCARDVAAPEHPVTLLPSLRGARFQGLVDLGVEAIEAIPADYDLTEKQEIVRQATITGEPWVAPGLRPALEAIEWPLHFLDFEAVQLALPPQPGMQPFDPLPFQFSCHVQSGPDAESVHHEFLATDTEDPREPLARALLTAVGDAGSIVVYSSYEARTIRNLAAWLPHLATALLALEDRLVDLLPIVRNHYYHPDFRGSWSIKYVLPALVPDMHYEGMEVADGTEAGRVWLEMLVTEDETERQRMERALRAYCAQDSLAMLRLRETLLART